MPIIALQAQPGSADEVHIFAAYRPILFRVEASAYPSPLGSIRNPPVVYCDIYFNSTFYKTLSCTQAVFLNDSSSIWQFDISASCQEYLTFLIPANGGTQIEADPFSVVAVQCRFRSSGIDPQGFLAIEGIVPTQGTGTKPPTAGTGTASEIFYVLNAVLQHDDSQDLATNLQYSRPNTSWDSQALPLSHRPNGYFLCKGDSDFYPFLYLGSKPLAKINIVRTFRDGSSSSTASIQVTTCSSVVSSIIALVLPNDNVGVSFQSSGQAQLWEWTVTGGDTWTTINSKNFTIVWEDLLNIIITESGLDIITEDGQLIIPEDLTVYKQYTLTIRPRCTNGAYGTSGSTTYTIDEPPVCPYTIMSLGSTDFAAKRITLAFTPPDFKILQLEWKFDYGNGFVSTAVSITYPNVLATKAFTTPINVAGNYLFRVRTICDTSYSDWTSWLSVPWGPPESASPVSVSVGNIVSLTSGVYAVSVNLTGAVSDDLVVTGYFLGDAASGSLQTFYFTCVIPAGALFGTVNVSGGITGGFTQNKKITTVTPNPTSTGQPIKF